MGDPSLASQIWVLIAERITLLRHIDYSLLPSLLELVSPCSHRQVPSSFHHLKFFVQLAKD